MSSLAIGEGSKKQPRDKDWVDYFFREGKEKDLRSCFAVFAEVCYMEGHIEVLHLVSLQGFSSFICLVL